MWVCKVEDVWIKSSELLKILNVKQSVGQSSNGLLFYMVLKAFLKTKSENPFHTRKQENLKENLFLYIQICILNTE